MTTITAIRGMNDIVPPLTDVWAFVEEQCKIVACAYGYHEIRFPLLEKTQLFKRTIGEVTDIVEKEMYTFEDRNGDSLSLRPEGTAGCVRAAIEQSLLHQGEQRLWYMGPMFRHERPQKGRYRQFQQFGIEALGMSDPAIEAEIILLTYRLWKQLGLKNQVELQLNSLGSSEARKQYRQQLVHYFKKHLEILDEDSQRRLETNPLRILDSKNPAMKTCLEGAPKLTDYLDEPSRLHFEHLKTVLKKAGVPFIVKPTLVRGLDYYSGTVFEWVTESLGAQGTVCAGGRYDALIEMLGGKATPAMGFALGVERLVALLENRTQEFLHQPDLYGVLMGEAAQEAGLLLAEQLRDALPHLSIVMNAGGGSFKSQFKRADRSGAKYALILGEDEIKNNTVALKPLRNNAEQKTLPITELITYLSEKN